MRRKKEIFDYKFLASILVIGFVLFLLFIALWNPQKPSQNISTQVPKTVYSK